MTNLDITGRLLASAITIIFAMILKVFFPDSIYLPAWIFGSVFFHVIDIIFKRIKK